MAILTTVRQGELMTQNYNLEKVTKLQSALRKLREMEKLARETSKLIEQEDIYTNVVGALRNTEDAITRTKNAINAEKSEYINKRWGGVLERLANNERKTNH